MNEHQPHHNPGEQPEQEANREQRPERHPRVWIGSLADYNAGTLTGDWVDAATSDETLLAAARAILASSEQPDAEEWAIFDYEDFGDFTVNQYEDLGTVAQVARGIQEHGDTFAFWADLHDADPEMLHQFEEAFLGQYDSPSDWAREVLEADDLERRIEDHLGSDLARYVHVDYAAWAQDAWLSGDIYVAHRDDGGVWVFNANP